jgi:phage tail-like protein
MAVLGALGVRSDPILGYNFVVSLLDTSSGLAQGVKTLAVSAIYDVALGGFTECSGLEMTLEFEQYNEGGRNGETLIFPTRVKWSNIILKKGVGVGTELWDWHYGFAKGQGKRRDGIIFLRNERGDPNNIWYFSRGLPVKYTGPTMNATQNNVAIESIEIAHEGIYQVPYVGAGAAATKRGIGLAV